MSLAAPIATFVDVLRKSQLIEAGQLAQVLKSAAAKNGKPEPFAAALIKEGLITPFQARQLLQGRYRDFILGNKYKVLEKLGVGGMGSVFLCEHLGLRRLVAVKKLPEDKVNAPGVLERFQREARAIAHLDHPNIVRALDFASEGKLHYLVMEYIDGINLDTLMVGHFKAKPLPIDRACHYIIQTALALQHAHEIGWVHRDIKPGNIIVDRAGAVKLLDLGLSRLLNNEHDNITKQFDEGATMGTVDYIAPEQALNMSAADIRSDIYSLGGTFYFLLSGRPPFHEGSVAQKLLAHQSKPPVSIRTYRPEVSAALDAVLMKMLAKQPEQRFQTPIEVADALSRWTAQGVTPPAPGEIPVPCPLVRQLLPGLSVKLVAQAAKPGPPSSKVIAAARAAAPISTRETVVERPSPPPSPRSSKPKSGRAKPKAGRTNQAAIVGGVLAAAAVLIPLVIYGVWLMNQPKSLPPLRPTAGLTADGGGRAKDSKGADAGPWAELMLVDPTQAREYVGKEARVRFTVKNHGSATELIFLNSDKDYRKSTNFTVVIPKASLPAFAEAGFKDVPTCFVDKTVEVRGTISIYARSDSVQIKVEDPKYIRLLD